jgi:N12 class adenine-specific DNA methylase
MSDKHLEYYRDHAIRIHPTGTFTIELDYDEYESTPEPRSMQTALREAKALIDQWHDENMATVRENRATATPVDTRKERYAKLVSLYALAIARQIIDNAYVEAIQNEFIALGAELNIEFESLYEQESQKHRADTSGTQRAATSQSGESGRSRQTAPEPGRSGTGGNVPALSDDAPDNDQRRGPGQRHAARGAAEQTQQAAVNYSLLTAPDIKLTRKERIELNRTAAALLKAQRTDYTAEERRALSLYTGHGGLASVDVGVLNQHYTRYSVTRFIWAAMIRLGFRGGWVLEPGCGVGNFIGTKPENTRMLAFDYDPVAAQIASILYPEDDVRQADFKEFDFEQHQSYIVAAIGNPPFGDYSRYNRNDTFAELKPRIHDHFILKMIETVRPGGIIGVISSTGTMDKKKTNIRQAIVDRAHFLGAYRLPNSTFEANASTTVTTDVMFFQKRRDQMSMSPTDRLFVESNLLDGTSARISAFYQEHPQYILGTLEVGTGQFGNQIGVRGQISEADLENILAAFPFKAPEAVAEIIADRPDAAIPRNKLKLPAEAASANAILFMLQQLISAQKEKASSAEKAEIRSDLKQYIRDHVKEYGWFAKSEVIKVYFGDTPDYNQLLVIAEPGSGGTITFSEILERDTLFNVEFSPKLSKDNIAEIVLYCRQVGVRSETDAIAQLTGWNAATIRAMADKHPSVFFDPELAEYRLRPEYISGNLLHKIAAAEAAGLEKNVAALREKLPARKSVTEINFDLADVNTYLPMEVAQAYVKYAVGGELAGVQRAWAIPKYDQRLSQMSGFGWKGDYAAIIEYYLNGSGYPKQSVSATASDAEKEKAIQDQIANNNKMRRLVPKRFREWLQEIADPEMRDKAVNAWNDTYNVTIEPDYTGETFACANMGSVWTNGKAFKPRDHQKKWVEKAMLVGSGINAHGVGAGKTLSAILLAGIMKERGLANKPMFVVPSKVVEKWIMEYQAAFPTAKVLNLKTDKTSKERLLSMVQQNSYDAIFVTHEGFKAIPNSPELMEEYMTLRMAKVESSIEKVKDQLTQQEIDDALAAANGQKRKMRNPLQKILKKLLLTKMQMEQKLSVALQGDKLNAIYFDELGVDALFVDEAHNFKNLFLSGTAVELGIGIAQSSDRAEEAFAKFFYINQTMGNRNVFLLTATPTNNTPLEAYIFMNAVAPHFLKDLKLDDVDSFISQYARIESVQTANMIGEYKDRLVVTGYKNLDTLRGIFNRYVEFIDTSEFPEIKAILPEAKYEAVYVEPTKRDNGVQKHIELRVNLVQNFKPMNMPRKGTGEDVTDNYLFVAGSGSRAAVDPAFYIVESVTAPDSQAAQILYKVRLHDGKVASELMWLEWERFILPEVATAIKHAARNDQTRKLIAEFESQDSSSLRQRANILKSMASGEYFKAPVPGRQVYDQLCIALEGAGFTGKGTSGRTASAWLNTQANIAGVKFNAAGGKLGSSYNFVMFDDNLVKIEDKIRVNDGGVEVWHGTKHDFDRFSTEHIGKGEGAHFFGWGLYFTEVRSIAEWYASSVAQSGDEVVLDTGMIESDTKAGTMCQRVAKNYWRQRRDVTRKDGEITEDAVNGQLIFCDPITTFSGRNFHRLLRDTLVAMGIPAKEIAIINGQENSKPEQKIKIQEAFNAGEIRVIIGNTSSMGEGMDLNRYCTDIHHLDVPWKPSELTQRNGRGLRQGNVNSEINIHYYLLRKSMDAYRYTLLNKKARWVKELWYGVDPEMEAEDTESSGGWDYETIMIALQDDPDKTQALQLSRDLKRTAAFVENLSDDYYSFNATIAAIKNEKDEYSTANNTWVYNQFSDFEAVTQTDLRSLSQYSYAQRGWSSGYVSRKDGGYLRGDTLTFAGVGESNRTITLGEIAISREAASNGKYYAQGRLFDRVYYGDDTDLKNLEKKLYDFVVRFASGYKAQRDRKLAKYRSYEQQVQVFEKRRETAKYEVAEGYMNVLNLIAKIDQVRATNPNIGRYIDERFLSEARSTFESRRSWAETLYEEGVKAGVVGQARQNPSGKLHLAYLGHVMKMETTKAWYEDEDGPAYMFCSPSGDRLYMVPSYRVRRAAGKVNAPGAQRMYEEFNHYDADHKDFEITLPGEETAMQRLGYAQTIWYSSDKIIQPGDQKGKVNYYVHDFDPGQRPVYEWDDIIVVTKLEIDGRGILN